MLVTVSGGGLTVVMLIGVSDGGIGGSTVVMLIGVTGSSTSGTGTGMIAAGAAVTAGITAAGVAGGCGFVRAGNAVGGVGGVLGCFGRAAPPTGGIVGTTNPDPDFDSRGTVSASADRSPIAMHSARA